MLRSINDIVCEINKYFDSLPSDSIVAPIAYTMIRDTETNERIPVTLDKDFDGQSLVPDDNTSVILYHKVLNVSIRRSTGTGRSQGVVNIYSMQMIIFLNRKSVNWSNDELFLYLQSVLPDRLPHTVIKPFESISTNITSANFNDTEVWRNEYANAFALKPEHNLFSINYTIETNFSKECFTSCLEETD